MNALILYLRLDHHHIMLLIENTLNHMVRKENHEV